MEFYGKWQQATLQLAETKGDLGKQLAALEQELVHSLDALAEEKERHAAVQVRCSACMQRVSEYECACVEGGSHTCR